MRGSGRDASMSAVERRPTAPVSVAVPSWTRAPTCSGRIHSRRRGWSSDPRRGQPWLRAGLPAHPRQTPASRSALFATSSIAAAIPVDYGWRRKLIDDLLRGDSDPGTLVQRWWRSALLWSAPCCRPGTGHRPAPESGAQLGHPGWRHASCLPGCPPVPARRWPPYGWSPAPLRLFAVVDGPPSRAWRRPRDRVGRRRRESACRRRPRQCPETP